jgi:hypothetical protein
MIYEIISYDMTAIGYQGLIALVIKFVADPEQEGGYR